MKVTIQDLIALGGVVVGGLALVLSILSAWWSRRDRHLEARRGLYADLWIACDTHQREVSGQVMWQLYDWPDKDPGIGPSEPARRALKAVELISPTLVIDAARRLYDATTRLGAQFRYDAEEGRGQWSRADWDQAVGEWGDAADAFQAAAAKDLGKPK